MRTHGTLIQWNDERGFGFIEPAVGTAKIFVHISAFPRDGIRPRIGELVSFDIEQRSDGKQRALRLMRPGSRAATHRAARTLPTAVRRNRFAEIAGLVIALAIVWYGYTHWGAQGVVSPAPLTRTAPAAPSAPAQLFTCDGRTYCSQMTSCAEATYFIKQCPGTQMDGDRDGVPCESQWCTPGGGN